MVHLFRYRVFSRHEPDLFSGAGFLLEDLVEDGEDDVESLVGGLFQGVEFAFEVFAEGEGVAHLNEGSHGLDVDVSASDKNDFTGYPGLLDRVIHRVFL
jgi:hypothetical protein